MWSAHHDAVMAATSSGCVAPVLAWRPMTTFLGRDEAINSTKARHQRDRDGVACFLHLRDLVYQHPEAASARAVSFVRTLEAKVATAKAERQRTEARARETSRR